MVSLALFQCPQCLKIFITKILIRNTISGGRPTLMFPGETCNGMIQTSPEESVECGFDFASLTVESFDIPVDAKKLIQPAR